MTFEYRARDSAGAVLEGTLEVDSAEEAQQRLRRDGYTVLHLEESEDEGLTLLARRVTKSEIIYMTSQLSIMIDTGISLATALSAIIEQERNPTLRIVLKQLKNGVESGEDFSAALARHPRLFDRTYVSLVKASETMGTLGAMLDRIATYLRKELDTRAKIRSALAYPGVMMVVAIAVTIFLLTGILPKFEPLFNRRGIVLPRPTVIMMGISSSLTGYWYVWLSAFVALVAALVVGKRSRPGRRVWDWMKINVPVLGPMIRKTIISRSVRTLGTMLSAGVPTLDAIRLCASISGNYFYEQLWTYVEDRVVAGSRICQALSGSKLMPATLVQMISSGEETGKLGFVLERVSDYYDREVESSVKTFTSLIEPLMITAMGVVVGGIGLGLLLPIFKLSQAPG